MRSSPAFCASRAASGLGRDGDSGDPRFGSAVLVNRRHGPHRRVGGGRDASGPLAGRPFLLSFYPLTYVGVFLLARDQVKKFTATTWINAAIAGLGAAAICAAFAFKGLCLSAAACPDGDQSRHLIGDLLLLGSWSLEPPWSGADGGPRGSCSPAGTRSTRSATPPTCSRTRSDRRTSGTCSTQSRGPHRSCWCRCPCGFRRSGLIRSNPTRCPGSWCPE